LEQALRDPALPPEAAERETAGGRPTRVDAARMLLYRIFSHVPRLSKPPPKGAARNFDSSEGAFEQQKAEISCSSLPFVAFPTRRPGMVTGVGERRVFLRASRFAHAHVRRVRARTDGEQPIDRLREISDP